jgi:guanylate kinase
MKKGPLIILSGPSGSGKSTVIRRVLETSGLPLHLSVSATTRAPRPGERDGIDYHFWKPEQFEAAVQAGALLEWARYVGNCYGTLREEVDPYRTKGMGVILDIDVQGMEQVRRLYPESVLVFLRASSLEVYEQRLRLRHTEDEVTIQRRLQAARRELAHADQYQFQVVNDRLADAVAQLQAIIEAQFQGGNTDA